MANLGLITKPTSVPLMQACAAVGQSALMHTYQQLFFGKKVVSQLLLSSDDFTSAVRYQNLQNALHELLKLGVVPVVNENDTVRSVNCRVRLATMTNSAPCLPGLSKPTGCSF